MNRPIVRLYGLVALLFALLVAFTSRWTVFEASSLRANHLNKRTLFEEEQVDRGEIVAADGSVLARDFRAGEGVYQRTYPTGELFAQPVGYYYLTPLELGSTGIERSYASHLSGKASGGLEEVLQQLQGHQLAGDKVVTTLDRGAQEVARSQLAGHEGAVVALDPRSGAVSVMASSPSFDPNALRTKAGYERLQSESRADPAARSFVNRATEFGYAPGSTFKIVTATAAIDTGAFTPQSTLSGRNDLLVSGLPLQNDQNDSFGQITLTQALAQSVNTVWAQVAERLGRATMQQYMERFGFDAKPHLDYPSEEMSTSGEVQHGRFIPATSSYVDLGRMGIGQDKLSVTPLQMALVAAAVANHGQLMAPHLAQRVVDSEGRTVLTVSPSVQSEVMKPGTAASVTAMMEAVVREGTGTPAQIPGVPVAGKTGTAETEVGTTLNNVWFIAFAPADAPRVAVAVTLRKVPGYGASYAAPVARAVIERVLHDRP